MGKLDNLTHLFWKENPDCYAELFNQFLYGEEVIRGSSLKPANLTNILFDRGRTLKRERDNFNIAEIRESDKEYLVLCGIEDSSYVDTTAVIRGIIYDGLGYNCQIKTFKEKDKLTGDEFLSGFPSDGILKPVHTLFFYWGNKPWNGPRCLFDMLDPQYVRKHKNLLDNYHLRIVIPAETNLKKISSLKTQLREIIGYINTCNDSERLTSMIHSDQFHFRNLSYSTAELLNAVTHSHLPLREFMNNDGDVDMCEAIDQMRNQIIEAKRETADLKRETADAKRESANAKRESAYANCKADAFEAYLRKLGVSEEEIKAITPDRKGFVS